MSTDHVVVTSIDHKLTLLCRHCGETRILSGGSIPAVIQNGEEFRNKHASCEPTRYPKHELNKD